MEARKLALSRIVLRIAALLFACIVLGNLANDTVFQDNVPYVGKACALVYLSDLDDYTAAPCEFGLACGAIALLIAVISTILDYISDVQGIASTLSRLSYITSLIASVVMAILWVAAFAYMTKEYVNVTDQLSFESYTNEMKSRIGAILAFSFLSIPVWIAVAVLSGISLNSSGASA